MRRLFYFLVIAAVYFLLAHSSLATTLTLVDTQPVEEIIDRLTGSVLQENIGLESHWWYLDPASRQRYPLKNGIYVTRLLHQVGQPVSNAVLAKIPTREKPDQADYNVVHNYRGQILLQIDDKGQAWYVNPLDNFRYQIDSGEKGLSTLKKLAIIVEDNDLEEIKIVDDLNFLPPIMPKFDHNQYWQVWSILKNNYYNQEKVDDQKMFYGSLSGLADSVDDPYTEFFSPLGKENFDQRFEEQEVEGIGAMVELFDGRVNIISPLNGSPAQKAGLEPGDQILKAGEKELSGLTLDESVNLIRGLVGSEVELTIFRPADNSTFTVKITREKITIPNLVGERLNNNLAYFKINIFSPDINNEFLKLKDELINVQTKGIILDLRNNPGGYTSSALSLVDNFLPANKVIMQEQYPNETFKYSTTDEDAITLPLVILVNEGTASASEITTAALQEYGVAKIVGQKTFGKGTGQSIVNFRDGSALKYTIFNWLTPLGRTIEHLGINPDYLIENLPGSDLQLQKAQQLLNN